MDQSLVEAFLATVPTIRRYVLGSEWMRTSTLPYLDRPQYVPTVAQFYLYILNSAALDLETRWNPDFAHICLEMAAEELGLQDVVCIPETF